MHDWNNLNNRDKRKQRKLTKNINDRNELSADVDFSQTQETESNHESNSDTRTSNSS